MKRKNYQLNSNKLVKKIKNDLKKKKVWRSGLVEYGMSKNKTDLKILKQKIEFALITARDYQDPQYVFPKNPFTRSIKKIILRLIRGYTRYQIVFNKNIMFLLDDLYKYIDSIEKKTNEKNRNR